MADIWKRTPTVDELMARHKGSAVTHLGIEITEVGPDFIRGRAPVDSRTIQPYGILHGGVSVLLAETLGSTGAACACEPSQRVVGLDINANHIRSVTAGWVTGTARPVHLGRTTQVWQIELVNDAGKLVCISRLTMAVLKNEPAA